MTVRTRALTRSVLAVGLAIPLLQQAAFAPPASAGARCSHTDHTHWHGETHWHTHNWTWQYSFDATTGDKTVHHEMFYLGTGSHDTWQSKGPCGLDGHTAELGLETNTGDTAVYSPLDEAEDPFVEGGVNLDDIERVLSGT